MRFIHTQNLTKGMILGKRLYNDNGELLLQEDVALTKTQIALIGKMRFNGVYIKDDISEGLEVKPLISDETKYEAINEVKKIAQSIGGRQQNGRALKDLEKVINSIVEQICNSPNFMIDMFDIRTFDEYTYYHSVNVAVLSIAIGYSLGLEKEQLENLGKSAALHDIGKILISNDIINKPGPLDKLELETIKTHPSLGCDYVESQRMLSPTVQSGIMDHHENFDGSGYPVGRKGDKISLFGRIIAVADVYDALVSDRPYRKAFSPTQTLEYIMAQTEKQFDPVVVYAFVQKITPYPVGTCVKLSTGEMAIICETEKRSCLRPKVRLFTRNGKMLDTPEIIDLEDMKYLNVVIESIAE